MTETIEFKGKNVDCAIQCACDELGVDKETLKFKIISRGSTGIFGLVGTKKARISVRQPVKESSPKKDEVASGNGVKNETCDKNVDMEAVADNGKAVIDRILELISPESSVSVGLKNSRIHYDIIGGDAAILIGKRGQTLDAIQYVAEKIINKQSEQRIRIQIDVEGYLENRKASLKELSGRLSEKVKRTGKPVTVGHMTAHDRRIVHLALKNDKKVRTQSIGDGFLRKLVIFPKRQQTRRKKSPQTETGQDR